MKRHWIVAVALVFLIGLFLVGCGDKSKTTINPEQFEKDCSVLVSNLSSMNELSEYAAACHLLIWEHLGANNTAKYAGYNGRLYSYGKDRYSVDYDLIYNALGYNTFDSSKKEKAGAIADQYVVALDGIKEYKELTKNEFNELRDNYSDEYELEEVKEYCLESIAFADFAVDIQGSYLTYSQKFSDFRSGLSKLKEAVELAH